MTWSCSKCGKPFLTEAERDRHEGICGRGYTPAKCIYCNGKGKDVYGVKCPYCNGSGYKTP